MMKTVTVNSYSVVEKLNSDAKLYNIQFDDNTQALMLGREGEAEQYVDKLVDVEFRDDIYKGEIKSFVATIAERKVINTINRREHIKLFADAVDNSSNIILRDIGIGEACNNIIVYCTHVEYNASMRTDWLDLIVSDKSRYISRIRLFTPNRNEVNFAGSYVKCDVRRNKYGFNTQEVTCCEGDYPPNPEVDIAECYIKDVFSTDQSMNTILDESNIIPFLKEHVGYEKGSLLVQTAMEIDIARELANVTPAIKIDDLMKAFIVDKFWVLNETARYPREFLCIHNALKFKNNLAPNTIDIICESPATKSVERDVYLQVKELVRTLIRIRRGDVDFEA